MKALIGHTGFVGGNLAAQGEFDEFYNSRNIGEIRGREFSLGVCAAAPAEKWKANLDPEADSRTIRGLIENLDAARFEHLVLISTVDVYPDPCGVDEATVIDPSRANPYGRHRRELEEFAAESFETTIVRLPALFGPGLKKNAVYDLIHDNMVEKIDSRAIFQFYDLANLSADVKRAREHDLSLLNLASEPVSMAEVARVAFGMEFENHVVDRPPRYDFRSIHDHLWGRDDGYLYGSAEVLGAMAGFVRSARAGRSPESL